MSIPSLSHFLLPLALFILHALAFAGLTDMLQGLFGESGETDDSSLSGLGMGDVSRRTLIVLRLIGDGERGVKAPLIFPQTVSRERGDRDSLEWWSVMLTRGCIKRVWRVK